MEIGVKYCGGCNPRYDRVAVVERLAAALPEVDFHAGTAGDDAPILLSICGCTARCLTLPPVLTEGKQVLWLTSEPEILTLARELRRIEKECL